MQHIGGQLLCSPSDLANFVACEHLAQLELGVALEGGKRPIVKNAYADLIKRKGEEHEASFLEALCADGHVVTQVGLRERFYQVTNRLAHAYLFQALNGMSTQLVFLYLVGDRDMNGPTSRREWEAALFVLEETLGLRGRKPGYVSEAYIDVSGAVPVAA